MTLTETMQTEQHGFKAHTDGGWDFAAPVQTRSERFTSVNVADFPKVTGREVNWKFTPIARIDTLLNGELDGSQPMHDTVEAEGLKLEWIDRDSQLIGRAGAPEDRASANAWSQFEKAMHLTVSGEHSDAITLARHGYGTEARAAHVIIEAAPHARAVVILQHEGDVQLSENIEIVVGDGAELTVVSVQQWEAEAIHLSSHFAVVGRDATLKHVVVSLGGSIVRVNPSIHLNEQGGNGEAFGAYFADAGQHLEHQVYMDHDAPHTRSRVTYKGALQGEGAHTVWIGDVLIRRSATGTDSYEQNRNLVLSEGTRADSIPNLEIETGDIEGAGHASATGRFDDEHIFYLQSRGISEEEARRLVVHGFLLEVIQQIGDEATEARLREAVEQELEQAVSA